MTRIGSPEPIAALNRVKIREYADAWEEREPLVDIRAYCGGVVCNEGICPYLRHTVADRLNHAQNSLPPGYRLKVGTALRTLSMQKRGWDGYHKRMREEHPDWPLSALRRATNKYHAPYDQKAPPGHCTGGAVDVGLLDPEGNALDMVAPTQGWDAVDTFSVKISPEARANRMLMVEAMLSAGFSNCRDEYWHYSWGDSAWAVRVGESECPYGWTHAPITLETDFPGASASELSIEFERDPNGKPTQAHGRCAFAPDAERLPDGNLLLAVGLYWAKDNPVSLRLALPPGMGTEFNTPLWIGNGKDVWEPLAVRAGQSEQEKELRLHIEPPFDRSILTTRKPEPIPETLPS